MRAILSVSILAGVVTSGVVLVVSAPPTHAQRVREVSERAARSRELGDQIRQALEQGRLKRALTLSDRHVREHPRDHIAWLYHALVQQRLGADQDAARAWRTLLELARPADNARIYPGRLITRARAFYGVGDRRAAMRLWGLATDLDQGRQSGWRPLYAHARDLARDARLDDALALIHMCVDAGLRNETVLLEDPALAPLRDAGALHLPVSRIRSENMGPKPIHALPNDRGETRQIRSANPAQAWIARWGDI